MKNWKQALLLCVALSIVATSAVPVLAAYGRHYYGSWSYNANTTYYYRSYYYQPTADYSGYRYHYCVYYPTQPTYVYYYNPYARQYWGRFDIKAQGYSLLAEKDRKENLKDIPDTAFPKPGEMPTIPESTENIRIPKIAADDLPTAETPKDAPGSK